MSPWLPAVVEGLRMSEAGLAALAIGFFFLTALRGFVWFVSTEPNESFNAWVEDVRTKCLWGAIFCVACWMSFAIAYQRVAHG